MKDIITLDFVSCDCLKGFIGYFQVKKNRTKQETKQN